MVRASDPSVLPCFKPLTWLLPWLQRFEKKQNEFQFCYKSLFHAPTVSPPFPTACVLSPVQSLASYRVVLLPFALRMRVARGRASALEALILAAPAGNLSLVYVRSQIHPDIQAIDSESHRIEPFQATVVKRRDRRPARAVWREAKFSRTLDVAGEDEPGSNDTGKAKPKPQERSRPDTSIMQEPKAAAPGAREETGDASRETCGNCGAMKHRLLSPLTAPTDPSSVGSRCICMNRQLHIRAVLPEREGLLESLTDDLPRKRRSEAFCPTNRSNLLRMERWVLIFFWLWFWLLGRPLNVS